MNTNFNEINARLEINKSKATLTLKETRLPVKLADKLDQAEKIIVHNVVAINGAYKICFSHDLSPHIIKEIIFDALSDVCGTIVLQTVIY